MFSHPVAKEVVFRSPHTIQKHKLSVSLLEEEDPPSADASTVAVLGVPQQLDRDMFEMFFESGNKTGGGPIKSVDYDCEPGVVYVEYERPSGKRILITWIYGCDFYLFYLQALCVLFINF